MKAKKQNQFLYKQSYFEPNIAVVYTGVLGNAYGYKVGSAEDMFYV